MSRCAWSLCLVVLGASTAWSQAPSLVLDKIPLPVQSPRLLGMSMDDDGDIWLGSTHRVIYRYRPSSGAVEEIKLPFDSSTSQTICLGKKTYLLGQTYSKLMIYDRVAKTFAEAALPSSKPEAWYGTDAVDGRHFYLFDRANGVIKWDSTIDKGKTIPYPYKTPLPASGRHVAKDGAIWCAVWDLPGGQYVPLGLARLDLRQDAFTGWFPFPDEGAADDPFKDAAATLFYPQSLKGKLVPFDFQERRWCKHIPVPEYGRRFGFIGGGTVHDNRWYFSLSTYNGTATGCDGKPYHFCNGLLEFDPATGKFGFLTLEVQDRYYQISYQLSAGGRLFATGNDIREPDGSLNGGKAGDAVFWQSRSRN